MRPRTIPSDARRVAVTRVDRADLAVRRTDGAMLWRRDLALEGLPLALGAGGERARGRDLHPPGEGVGLAYGVPGRSAGPGRHGNWPKPRRRWSSRPRRQAVATCGCPATEAWTRRARLQAQRGLAARFGADKGSVSGEHLGRLAGFKNWKRGGCWVNLVCRMDGSRRFPVEPMEAPPVPSRGLTAPPRPGAKGGAGDGSASAQEWGWVCRLLETGQTPEKVYQMLVDRAASRRGSDVERYARRTVEKAMARTQPSAQRGR